MTKRERLIRNCIKKLQSEVINWPEKDYFKIDNIFKRKLMTADIFRLRLRLVKKHDKKGIRKIVHDIFGRQTTYPDGTKHFISNTWHEN